MLTVSRARELAGGFARAVVHGGQGDWRAGAERISALDGKDWLLLDAAARSHTYSAAAPVSGTGGWLGSSIEEPTGFVAAVTGMHVDGRIRQRATGFLAAGPGPLRAAALALRAMDHVPQVREVALRGLAAGRDADATGALLAVLLAGDRRQHTRVALDAVRTALIGDGPAAGPLAAVTDSPHRAVRRWAFELAHEQRLLTPGRLLAAAGSERDQLIAARCAGWLLDVATPEEIVELLGVRSVEARMAALGRVADADLDDAVLLPMMADRAPRLREVARWRARSRGVDVAGWYRNRLAEEPLSAGAHAACLDGLRRVGGPGDLHVFLPGLGHPAPAVRAAALTGVGALGPAEQTRELVGPLLLDPSPRVSSAAARVLAGAGSAGAHAARAWASPLPGNRRAAWLLTRSDGGWGRVEADLRAAGDPDAHLASTGQAGIRNWLVSSAATTWDVLPAARRERIRHLIEAWDAAEWERSTVAFHAGITRPGNEPAPIADETPAVHRAPARRPFRFLRRR